MGVTVAGMPVCNFTCAAQATTTRQPRLKQHPAQRNWRGRQLMQAPNEASAQLGVAAIHKVRGGCESCRDIAVHFGPDSTCVAKGHGCAILRNILAVKFDVQHGFKSSLRLACSHLAQRVIRQIQLCDAMLGGSHVRDLRKAHHLLGALIDQDHWQVIGFAHERDRLCPRCVCRSCKYTDGPKLGTRLAPCRHSRRR